MDSNYVMDLIKNNHKLNLLIARVQLNLEEALHPYGEDSNRLINIVLKDIKQTTKGESNE